MRLKVRSVRVAVARATGVGLAAILLPTPLLAQTSDQPKRVDKKQVTGTNIKRVDSETAAPIQIITADDLKRSGATTIAEALRNLPIANAGSLNDIATSNSFAVGSSSISLRGLGASATLILLNGRRLASYGLANGGQFQFVNLDTLPLAVVDRIEILKDGASAIYGSEAMAGVINIILRRDYTGLEATTTFSEKGDNLYRVWRAGGTAGFGDLAKDRYNVFVNFEHYDRDAVKFRQSEPFLTRPEYQSLLGIGTALSSNAYPGNYRALPGTKPGFSGSLAAPGCTRPVGAACVFDQYADISTVPKAERNSGFFKFSWDITPNLSAFAEASISKTETTFTSAPSLLNELGTSWFNVNTLDFNFINLIFPVGDPNNPYSTPVGFRHRFAELGPTSIKVKTQADRYLAGLKGTFASWDWETAVLYMKSDTDVDYRGYLRASALQSLIDTGGYNFINPTANSAAVLAAVSPTAKNFGNSSITSFDFKASRELWQLPGGPMGLAFGLEHRKEKLDTQPDALFASGDIVGFGANSASGDRNVTSAYGELALPITKTIEAQLAVRTDHYSDYGSSTTPKVGIKWKVIPALVLRGTYAEGFRAPSLPEISKSFSAGFYNDLPDTRRCPTTQADADCHASVPVLFGANANLKAEKSKSYTLGGVWEPVQDMAITLDFYRIRRENEIGLLDPTFLIVNEDRYPGYVQRGPVDVPGLPGPLVSFKSLYSNLGETTIKGLDLEIEKRITLGEYGKLRFLAVGNYVDSYMNSPNVGEPAVEYNGTYNQPRVRASALMTWTYKNWSMTPSLNYTGRFKLIGTPYETCVLEGIFDSGCEIKAWTTYNFFIQNEPIKNLLLSVSIQNVTDKMPPFDLNASTRMFNATYHNPYGRYYTFGVTYKFK